MEAGVDCAVSYRMKVDHGFAQPLEFLTGALDRYPVVPIFVNSVATPVPAFRRVRLLGEAVGRYAASLNKRVLFLASGGLSHNPPVPQLHSATAEVAERLIAGRNPTLEARLKRQQTVIDAARAFAQGANDLRQLNPGWDRKFLDVLRSRNLEQFDAMSNDEVTAAGGNSAHEVKGWVAANAAMKALTGDRYQIDSVYYAAIPEWIAGFATLQGNALK